MVEAPKNKASKTIFKVDSAFSSPKWPNIDPSHQDIILQLLSNLLLPISQHRSNHIIPSKGKRSGKRKRKAQSISEGDDGAPSRPPPPAIAEHILVGINSTTRHLEALVSSHGSYQSQEPASPESASAKPLVAIFLTRSQTFLPYSHLPTLIALASAAQPSRPATRLVPLTPFSEMKLCEALGTARAGVVGVFENAPGSEPLLDYVKEHVEPVDVPWVREVSAGKWLGTNILMGEESREQKTGSVEK